LPYIFIRDLKVDTIVGLNDNERHTAQTLSFDIELGLPNRRAFSSDQLSDTIDYSRVAALVKRELGAHQCLLLERLAQQLCDRIQAEFEPSWIRMSVAKSGIVPGASQVGVVLEQGRRANYRSSSN
jgi:7,8-dihydroneopterin aldolase/epimerase/oxygenase